MSNKTKALYDAVLDRLREIMETIPGTGYQIELFVSDFESAIQSAMKRAFPGARAVGCWFHFGQVHFNRNAFFNTETVANNSLLFLFLGYLSAGC